MKQSIVKRMLATALSLLMLCTLLPTTALAEETPLTMEEVFSNPTPLTDGFNETVTLSILGYLSEDQSDSRACLPFSYENKGDRPVEVTLSAYGSQDMLFYVYETDDTNALFHIDFVDGDVLDNNGEEYTLLIPAGAKYLFGVGAYTDDVTTTATVEFSVSDDIFYTVEEMLASTTPLSTDPVTVALSDRFVDEGGYSCYGKAFTVKVTDEGDAPWVLTAVAEDDLYIIVYTKEEDDSYAYYETWDEDVLPNYSEACLLETDVEYTFIVCSYNPEEPLDVTLSLVTAKSEEDFIKAAIPVKAYPFTASPTYTDIYYVDGALYASAPYAIEMKEGDSLLLSTEDEFAFTRILCKDEDGLLRHETDFSIDNYRQPTPLADVFRADADGTYYFFVSFAGDLTIDYFTGTVANTGETIADGPDPVHIKFLHFFEKGEIGGPAGTYYGSYTRLAYTVDLKKDQRIASTSSFNGEPYSLSVLNENGEEVDYLYPRQFFTAPEDGTYTLEFWLPYTKESASYGVELYGVDYLPTIESLMDEQELTTYPNNSGTIATGQLTAVDYWLTYMNAFAFNLDAGKAYAYTLDPTDSESYMYLFRKAAGEEGGYELLIEGYSSILYTPDVDERVYLVVETAESKSFRFFSKEYIDDDLDFTDPDNLPTPGEEDLWSWDPTTNTLTLKDGFSIATAYNPFILPEDAIILIDGFVTVESVDDTLVGYNLTIRGKNPAPGNNAPMDKLTIVSGDDAIDATYLKLEDLLLDIKADSDGMYVEESMSVENCSITIESGDEGIDCDNYDDEETGECLSECEIYNSTLTINSPTDEAIDVDSLLLSHCVTTLTAGEDADEDSSYEAIDAEVEVVVDGGELTALSYVDNAIDAPSLEIKNSAKLKLETLSSYGYAALGVGELIYDGDALLKDGIYVTAAYGDINMNGNVAAEDALTALQIATDKVSADNAEYLIADVDGNGIVSANDALMILQYATKKISQFPMDIPTGEPDQGIGSGDGVNDSING